MPVMTYLGSTSPAADIEAINGGDIAENQAGRLEADPMFGEVAPRLGGIPFKLSITH